jgi:hypothetical protein
MLRITLATSRQFVARRQQNWLLARIMNRSVGALFIALFLSSSPLLLAQSKFVEDRLILLSSSDAPGTIPKQRIASCLEQLVHEWKLEEHNLPQIVFIHASGENAANVQIKEKVAVRKNGLHGQPTEYFEIWIVGEPQLPTIVVALENFSNRTFSCDSAMNNGTP